MAMEMEVDRIIEIIVSNNFRDINMNNNQTEISIQDKIAKQYGARINYISASDKPEEQKKAEIEKLYINGTFDPRRPEVSYTSRNQAERSLKVQEILDSLSDEEFLTDSYVLNWHDLLNS